MTPLPVPTVLTVLNVVMVVLIYSGTLLDYVPPIIGYSMGGAGLVTLPFMIWFTLNSMERW